MRIATITKYAYGATVALAVLSGASIVLMNRAVEDERTALADRAEQRQLSFDLTNASDYLTREARLYTIFGDQKHADNYWGEVNETKTRDRVVSRLQELGLPEEELALVEQAKANSDALIDLERAALQTVADGDLDLARYLMYGEEYDAAKELVAAPIIAFRSKLIERTDAAVDDAQGLASAMSWLVTGSVAAAMLGFLAILHFVLSRRAVAPMVRMGDVVSRLAEGNFSTEVPEQARQDEVGDMARAVQILKESGQERARLEAEQARDRAQKEERQAAIEALISDFDRSATEALEAVSTASHGLGQTANAMTALAEQTSEQAVLSAAAAEETSANVQSVSASTEEMGASIREIARQIGQASSIAGDAKSRSDQSVTTVRELDAAVQSIGDVVKLITDIAEQTNLLALNATIEAARAGDAGKGFAVVASEVKNLATETAKATDEIVKQISSVQGATKDTITVIDSIGLTISEINEISTAIAAAIEQQNAATEEIARNVQEAARGTQDVSENVGRVREATTETGTAAAQVLDASSEVDRQAETIRQRVERFLTGIRAA